MNVFLNALKESENKDKYHDLAMETEVENFTNREWWFQYSNKKIIKGFGGWRRSGDHPNYIIIDNSQITEKSPGDLRRLAVTKTTVKNHQLKLM